METRYVFNHVLKVSKSSITQEAYLRGSWVSIGDKVVQNIIRRPGLILICHSVLTHGDNTFFGNKQLIHENFCEFLITFLLTVGQSYSHYQLDCIKLQILKFYLFHNTGT